MLRILAQELAALSRRDRKLVLAALDPADRERLHGAMAGAAPEPARADTAAARHSSWMQALIHAARDGTDASFTRCAGEALLGGVIDRAEPTGRAAGRSLMQAAGGLFNPTRGR